MTDCCAVAHLTRLFLCVSRTTPCLFSPCLPQNPGLYDALIDTTPNQSDDTFRQSPTSMRQRDTHATRRQVVAPPLVHLLTYLSARRLCLC